MEYYEFTQPYHQTLPPPPPSHHTFSNAPKHKRQAPSHIVMMMTIVMLNDNLQIVETIGGMRGVHNSRLQYYFSDHYI